MKARLRQLPPVCILVSLAKLLTGRLRLSRLYVGNDIHMENGDGFRVFRNIIRMRYNMTRDLHWSDHSCVFAVTFKFARLSHRANKIASVIPMLVIAGYPGFQQKIYAVNPENGYWQGMYQWESPAHLEDYKKSFIYRMMNKRAVAESIQTLQWKDQTLCNFILLHTDKQFDSNNNLI